MHVHIKFQFTLGPLGDLIDCVWAALLMYSSHMLLLLGSHA